MSKDEKDDDQPRYTLWNIPSDQWRELPSFPESSLEIDEDVEMPEYFLEEVKKFLNRK